MEKSQVQQGFRSGLSCSQQTLAAVIEELGYDKEEAYRLGNAFSGGMLVGDTCGAVTGALMAIGLAFGNSEPGNREQDALCRAKAMEFQRRFQEKHGSTICRDLVGYDFRDPEQYLEAKTNGKIMETCSGLVTDAVAILEDILAEA